MNPAPHARLTAFAAAGVAAGMVALAFASAPLYDLFCRVTGYGGTTQRAAAPAGARLERTITVRFNADVAHDMPWRFQPLQPSLTVRLGEEVLAHYRAHNPGRDTIVGTATFNVTPDKAGIYFNKVDCFCFVEQRLAPGQSVDLPVAFFVDPALAQRRQDADIAEITLSYTFFVKRREAPADAAAPRPNLTMATE